MLDSWDGYATWRTGELEALLQGPRPAVEKIEAWCHDGPELALLALVQSVQQATLRP